MVNIFEKRRKCWLPALMVEFVHEKVEKIIGKGNWHFPVFCYIFNLFKENVITKAALDLFS